MSSVVKSSPEQLAPLVSRLVRQVFAAYESKDRTLLEEILSEDFTFSSPLDDHIPRPDYFTKCWPNSEKVRVFHIEKLFVEKSEAFVLYECVQTSGAKFRNTEFFTIEGNKIKKIDVFFGFVPTEPAKQE
jgi:ketosteroid isomerase-like protein